MFPLKSSEPVKRYTIGIWLLIIINFGIYFYFYENRFPLLFTDYGFIPYKLSMPDNVIGIWEKACSFFTYMFLHGNFLHVFVNMYFLYVFGRNIEDKLGTLPFLSVYILTGVIAVIPEAVMNPMMTSPVLGSSGAIYGIMGMYLVFFPFSKIKTFIFLIIYAKIKNIYAAFIMLLFVFLHILLWAAEQYIDISVYIGYIRDLTGLGDRYADIFNVAFLTHCGGFAAGLVIGIIAQIIIKLKHKSD